MNNADLNWAAPSVVGGSGHNTTATTGEASDTLSSCPVEWARNYIRRGWAPIPVQLRSKNPALAGWPELRITEDEVEALFAHPCNIGLLCGTPSGALVDVDLDTPAAVAAARLLLPPTALIHGRPGNPSSHHWYRVTDGVPDTVRLDASATEGRATLIEIRSTGAQTIVPPSVHPSGEKLIWERFGEPAEVSRSELLEAVHTTAAAALIAGAWREGIRHQATLAIAGALLRNGWSVERATRFVQAVCQAAQDEEEQARLRDVWTTSRQLELGEKVTGIPTLNSLLGAVIGSRLAQWLNLTHGRPSLAIRRAAAQQSTPVLAGEALHGLAGKVVGAIEPHTEASPVAVLAQLLAAFGNVIGRRPHFQAEADYHALNLFVTLVGDTAKARKGTSWGYIRRLFGIVDPDWADNRIQSGLSSGEGLIWAVRDPIEKRRSVRTANGEEPRIETVVEDAGVEDKRLLCLEPEFASVLKATSREGNILSAVVRQAWDCGQLSTLTKNSPARASRAHISIIGHITREELRRYLTDTEVANGFANRFIFLHVTRSKLLPEGGSLDGEKIRHLAGQLREAVEFARDRDEICRDGEARAIWLQVYGPLSDARPGLAGSLLARAEAQVMRLACLYALLDRRALIEAEHLKAALALWQYAEESVRFVFGEAIGDFTADCILEALRNQPEGLTRTQIRDLFSRNRRVGDIDRALGVLLANGLAVNVMDNTDGRPAERWLSTGRATT